MNDAQRYQLALRLVEAAERIALHKPTSGGGDAPEANKPLPPPRPPHDDDDPYLSTNEEDELSRAMNAMIGTFDRSKEAADDEPASLDDLPPEEE